MTIRRIANGMARGAALIVTDRRWGVTMSAAALGFGLFAGVAIGPGAAGTLATGPPQLIELPSLLADGSSAEEEDGASRSGRALAGTAPGPAPAEEPSTLEAFPSTAPIAPEASEPPPAEEGPAPESRPPDAEEPEAVETTELAGTVVHANPAAGSYALAIKGGELVPIHAAKLPRPGTALSLEGLQLANGTFAEEGVRRRTGEKPEASLRGVITFVNPDPLAPAYTVSGRGASLLVQVPPDPTGIAPALPALGSYVTARVGIEPGAGLVQRELEIEPGAPATYLDLSGIYGGIAPETGKLLLSADDTRATGQDLALIVSPKVDATKLRQGDSYLATATVEADGSLTLVGIAADEHLKGAEDPTSGQGDLKRRARSG